MYFGGVFGRLILICLYVFNVFTKDNPSLTGVLKNKGGREIIGEERERERDGERERVRERERGRGRERKREGGRGRERKREGGRERAYRVILVVSDDIITEDAPSFLPTLYK